MKFIPLAFLLFFSMYVNAQPQQKREKMIVDGMERAFITYLPSVSKQSNLPVIISLHGGFASPKGMFHLADFRPIADRENVIIVCPASKRIWHDGRDIKGIDDVKFIDQLITYLINTYQADANRIYVTGISNGGFMTTRLACELHKRIAAIAVVAATLNIKEGYEPVSGMPVMYMHGTKDKIVNYSGGKMFGRTTYSQPEILKKWVELDKCSHKPVITNIADTANDGTSIIKEEYTNPANGLKVVGYTINNGGHTWPGGWQYLPEFVIGKTTHNLNACETIWTFFKDYRLNHHHKIVSEID